jgi:hypothetical protein
MAARSAPSFRSSLPMKESFMDRVLTLLVCAMATAAAPVAPAPPPRPAQAMETLTLAP